MKRNREHSTAEAAEAAVSSVSIEQTKQLKIILSRRTKKLSRIWILRARKYKKNPFEHAQKNMLKSMWVRGNKGVSMHASFIVYPYDDVTDDDDVGGRRIMIQN